MKHVPPLLVGVAALLLFRCGPGRPTASAVPSPADTVRPGAVCETLPTPRAVVAAAQTASARPAPEPASRPDSVSVSKTQIPVPPPAKAAVLPRMWDYGLETCIPCRTMMAILGPMTQEYAGRVEIRIVNVHSEPELTAQARIQIIPTQIFYDPDGKELFRHIGVYPRDSIVARFREFGWER